MTTLRELPGQTCATLTARRDCADEHAITDVVTGDSWTQLVNYSHRLMTYD